MIHGVIATALAVLIAQQGETPGTRAAPPTAPDVVVTGTRPASPAEKKALREMVSSMTPVKSVDDALPRFQSRVCPVVLGLPTSIATTFADRIVAVARTLGLEAQTGRCQANLVVMVVPSGQAVVKELRRIGHGSLSSLSPYAIGRLIRDDGPVHSWAATERKSRDGDPLNAVSRFMKVRDASIIQLATRLDIEGTIVLLDQSAVIGKTVRQLADYTAMAALSQARPPADGAVRATILRLFLDSANAPKELTPFDQAYLHALYHGQATDGPFNKIAAIARAVAKAPAETPPTPAGTATPAGVSP